MKHPITGYGANGDLIVVVNHQRQLSGYTLLDLALLLTGLSVLTSYRVPVIAFTLIEVCTVLVIMSIVCGAVLVKLAQDTRRNKEIDLQKRLDRIERALRTYAKVNARLPCPADGTKRKDLDSLFGTEADNPGSCVGGVTAANVDDGMDTVGGVLPVRTLAAFGLQDDDVFDAYGNQFSYFVSKAGTGLASLQNTPASGILGQIKVHDGSGSLRTSTAIVMVLTHGSNGNGAYQAGGVRKYGTSTNVDEWLNCHCNATGPIAFTSAFVLHPPTVSVANPLDSFDDSGRYYFRSSFAWTIAAPSPIPIPNPLPVPDQPPDSVVDSPP